MKWIISASLATMAMASCSMAAVSLSLSKSQKPHHGSHKRYLAGRDSKSQEVLSNHRMYYMANVQIGNPPQNISLDIDTGSSDTWIPWVNSAVCKSDPQACITPFDPKKSSSYKVIQPDRFRVAYVDGSSSKGDYFTDDLLFGDDTINSLQMGLGKVLGRSVGNFGIMGLGYSEAVFPNRDNPETTTIEGYEYPNIVDSMVNQGIIEIPAYSLYLDDLESSTATLLFGAMDTDKYLGNLIQIPITPTKLPNGTAMYRELSIPWCSFTFSNSTRQVGQLLTPPGFGETVLLDSGTSLTYFPRKLYDRLASLLKAHHDFSYDGDFVDCSLLTELPGSTFDFGFGNNSTIRVPLNELILPMEFLFPGSLGKTISQRLPFEKACVLGIVPQDTTNAGLNYPFLFGDTFLRSAYVVYDLKNNLIGMGQTNFNSTTSKIVEFKASQAAIPMISGAAIPPAIQTAKPTGTGMRNAQITASFGVLAAPTEEYDPTIQSSTAKFPCPMSNDAPSSIAIGVTWLIVLAVAVFLALLL